MFTIGRPCPTGVCAKPWSVSSRVKIWGASTPKGRNVVSQSHLGGSTCTPVWERLLLLRAFQIFNMSIHSGDICSQSWKMPKSCGILDVFATQILLWLSFQKLYPNYHACIAARHVEKFSAVTPSSPKVIGIHNLNFKPTFKCLPLKFFEGAAFPSVNL